MMKPFLISFLLFLSYSLSFGQVTINEYSASNLYSFEDSFGKTEDWIELYNTTSTPIDLSGWHVSDKEDKPTKYRIPENTTIAANGFITFLCSGRDTFINGEYHTGFKLSQTSRKDMVVLANPAGNVVEAFEMQITLTEHSMCRENDGTDNWVVSVNPTFNASNSGPQQYARYTAVPTMSLEGGFYDGVQQVEIVNNEPNSKLTYTTNGSHPRSNSTEYSGPITVDATTVIKARAFSEDNNILAGKTGFNTYFIDEDFSLAVFSVASEDVEDLANGQGEVIPVGSIEYFNLDKERQATSFGSLNRHGQDSWVLPHRSLDWISRDEMGYSKAVEAPLFSYSKRDEYQKFMFRNSGDDNYPAVDDFDHEGSAHVRDEYVQQLALEGGMEVDLRANERVILFLNGKYWGVYGMRERPVDHDYTDEYYDQGKYDIQYLSTWGDTEIEYGGMQAAVDWINLRNYVLENDMSDAANYEYAEGELNMLSLIDYMLVNLNVVARDWLNYNTGWWRGLNPEGKHKKWGYILWDLDATFDYYINYTNIPNTRPDADPCDIEDISDYMDEFFGTDDSLRINEFVNFCPNINTPGYSNMDTSFLLTLSISPQCCFGEWGEECETLYNQIETGDTDFIEDFYLGDVGKHEKIFLKLIEESKVFEELYYARYADLMNTVYSCENMLTTLDSMIAVIEPEMPDQIERWGGTLSGWEANVERLRAFVSARCTLLDDGLLECYDELSGPYDITLLTEPDGVGEIDFNTLDIESFPWNGQYFGGMVNKIKAKVFNEFENSYVFSHWESKTGSVIAPSVSDRLATIELTSSDTLVAVFDQISSTTDINNNIEARIMPNPAKDFLLIDYKLAQSANVSLDLISVTGQVVSTFNEVKGSKRKGLHQAQIHLSDDIISGFYILRLRVDNQIRTFKINIL